MPGFQLEWSDEYLIGVGELDYEHKDLFIRLNELHEELIQHEDKDEIERCLGEIYARLSAHFALEENFMRKSKSLNYVRHKQEHDAFLEDFIDIINDFRVSPELSEGGELAEFLQYWILNHIITSDREMVSK